MRTKEEILRATDLPSLIERLTGLEFRNKRIPCPLHGGEGDNFAIWKGRGGIPMWTCHSRCGSGNAIDFVILHQNLDFKGALEFLGGPTAALSPKIAPQRKRTPERKKRTDPHRFQTALNCWLIDAQLGLMERPDIERRLESWGWGPAVPILWKIGWWGQSQSRPGHKWGRPKEQWLPAGLTIPYLGAQGFATAAQIRTEQGRPKYFFLGERGLFGEHLWEGHATLLLLEGEKDTITAWQAARWAGLDVDVACLGGAGGRPSPRVRLKMARYKRIYALFDADGPGMAGLEKLAAQLDCQPLPPLPGGGDATDYQIATGNLGPWLKSKI